VSVHYTWASNALTLPPNERAVLGILADYANEFGIAWPSQATIGKRCQRGERWVQAIMARLVRSGLVQREYRRDSRGLRYRLMFPSRRQAQVSTSCAKPVENSSREVDTDRIRPDQMIGSDPIKRSGQTRSNDPTIQSGIRSEIQSRRTTAAADGVGIPSVGNHKQRRGKMLDAKTCLHQQLCAIAKDVRDENGDGVDWKETIKDRVEKLGYQRPSSRDVTKAMDMVEASGPRRDRKEKEADATAEEIHPFPDKVSSLHPSVQELVLPVWKRIAGIA